MVSASETSKGSPAADVLQNLVIPEADHLVSPPFEPGRSRRVRFLPFGVLPAIDLHDQTPPATGEVDDVSTDGRLMPEVTAIQLSRAKSRPQSMLGQRPLGAQPPGARACVHGDPPPCLPPARGEEFKWGLSPVQGEETGLDAAYVCDLPASPLRGEGTVRGHREAVQGTGRWTSTVRIAGEAPFTLLPPVQGGGREGG